MKIVQFDGMTVYGMSVRTENAREKDPETSQIGGLWQQFHQQVTPSLPEAFPLFGVYYAYESDVNGAYQVLAGTTVANAVTKPLERLTVPAGRYAVFSGEGEMPHLVISLWQEVWAHFDESSATQQRAYTHDFEIYHSMQSMEIFISIA